MIVTEKIQISIKERLFDFHDILKLMGNNTVNLSEFLDLWKAVKIYEFIQGHPEINYVNKFEIFRQLNRFMNMKSLNKLTYFNSKRYERVIKQNQVDMDVILYLHELGIEFDNGSNRFYNNERKRHYRYIYYLEFTCHEFFDKLLKDSDFINSTEPNHRTCISKVLPTVRQRSVHNSIHRPFYNHSTESNTISSSAVYAVYSDSNNYTTDTTI